MQKIILFSLIFSALFMNAGSQAKAQTSQAAFRFSSINQVALLNGSNGQSAAIQTINGISNNNWFVGVGAGIDYYGTRSIPLFVDVRKNLNNNHVTPFIYADGGFNYSWATKSQNFEKGYTYSAKPGAYFDGGAGINIRTKNTGAFVLSAGYNYKQSNEKTESFSYWSWTSPEKVYEFYNYKYRRIVIKLGFTF